ncbi:MAG: cation diffusion facilitator family transporter [Sulfurimonas sp.]|nr:cation diffusion facilitator family transporter [Sulfurimonas sp.]
MILLIIIFNIIIIFAEIFFGLISNSFALIADALHNTGDVIAIIITYIALKLGTKKSTFKYTFGFIKSEMMAAFVNTLFLSLTMFYMIYEAINRFFNPEIIEPMYMIVVGIIAVIANSISAYILHRLGVETHEHSHEDEHYHHHEDANIRSAYLHMLSDALISVGVVVAGIFIYYFKIYYIDSVLTIVFSIYILNHSFPLLKKSFLSLMDANSVDISKDELDAIIKSNEAVVEYHDLHISKPSSKHSFISFHIVLNNDMLSLKDIEEITESIRYKLKENHFSHIIVQVDSSSSIRNNINCIDC